MSPPRLNARALPVTALATISPAATVGRVGGGKSLGSRGTKTHTVPVATRAAKCFAPIDDSMTDRCAPAQVSLAAPTRFRGLSGLFLGQLIAAVNAIRSRNQPALASARGTADAPNRRSSYVFTNRATAPALPLSISEADLAFFERLLGEIQIAYGGEATEELGARTTPEMFSYFSHDLYENGKQGRRTILADVKLLSGDLWESWTENGSDYATVAMCYSLVDATIDRQTGALISGDAIHAAPATELWTFRRDERADGWELSAIQQAA